MEEAAAAAAEVRYGIVGVGMMGREHLHNLAHLATEVEREQSVRVRVTGLADPHQESLRLGLQLAAELGLPPPQVRISPLHPPDYPRDSEFGSFSWPLAKIARYWLRSPNCSP